MALRSLINNLVSKQPKATPDQTIADEIRPTPGTPPAEDIDLIFAALYELAHDWERAAPFAAHRTVAAFGHQWSSIPTGRFMLSDAVFKADVDRIISEEELQIDREWFKGKQALDAGCGGGRWSYGLAKLGASVTAADANPSALDATRSALTELGVPAKFLRTELESIDTKLPAESYDLVWSWGVLHHCTSFTRSIENLVNLLKPGGLLHLYLYGRESIGFWDDVALFKERLRYNFAKDDHERQGLLLTKSRSINVDLHHAHDILAPLINRRFRFEEVRDLLTGYGLCHVRRTVQHTELWIRAVKGPDNATIERYGRAPKQPPYWFQL
jgi:SAM-dependent methyltransferase